MESWKMHLHLTLKYKIALSSQNLRIRYNPWILCIISLSFTSLLITVSSRDSIYLYLDFFWLKFLFISKPSEWVLNSGFLLWPFPYILQTSRSASLWYLRYLCSLSYYSISELHTSHACPQETHRYFFPPILGNMDYLNRKETADCH